MVLAVHGRRGHGVNASVRVRVLVDLAPVGHGAGGGGRQQIAEVIGREHVEARSYSLASDMSAVAITFDISFTHDGETDGEAIYCKCELLYQLRRYTTIQPSL